MVARGDLGLEVPLEEVPIIQRDVIAGAARQSAGYRRHPDARVHGAYLRPTRAEVTDVATAIFQGADAIMPRRRPAGPASG
jgi:pyruvate kinase